ncbi:hypothetical protein HPP92_027231 [Vanilla planifolia]|uniref:DUF3741 domain-containing protein n=1 Tax=Vanilla planifolia TaxID=51239 RepID=A0A835U6D4_VANPL|nr:hypothetical protein HPP92_027231 [Vanilla planifolia]KAG0449596.1 hypothetical protein HPP92_027297 [Vanilla planifolia]
MDTKMSQRMDMKRKSHGVIARLMGLDNTLPANSLIEPTESYVKDGGSSHNYFEERGIRDHRLRQFGYDERFVTGEVHRDGHKNNVLVNAYEGKERPSSRTNCFNDQVLPKGRPNISEHQKIMSLVPDKLMEAKILKRHEKVCESKEFDDVLESLSYNRDLFFKFLKDPNCFFSKHLKELHLIPPPRQAKQITLLKPSNVVETNSEDQLKQYKDDRVWEMQNTLWRSDAVQHPKTEKLSQPTRIVILKPSQKKHYDSKAQATPFTSLQEPTERESCHSGLRPGIYMDSRDVAREFTLKMHEYLSRHCDESLSPSSWHYTSNLHGTPCSNSSMSRASHSSESSVLREAKKRLSERCALVAVNGIHQEQLQERRSSTLGEMLAVRELKSEDVNDIGPSESRTCSSEENFRMPAACLSILRTKSEKEESNANLSKSKFVPTSLSFGDIGLNRDDSESLKDYSVTSEGITKPRRGKTSFKGRVSSLFFLKNKEAVTEKCASSLLASSYDVLPTTQTSIVSKNLDDSALVHSSVSRESSPGNFAVASDRISSHHVLHDKEDEILILTEQVTSFDVDPAPSSVISEKLAQNQDHQAPLPY